MPEEAMKIWEQVLRGVEIQDEGGEGPQRVRASQSTRCQTLPIQ